MKVAVIIYGQLRELDISIKSWDFIKILDCDFYFSNWSKTYVQSGNLGIKDIRYIDKQDILKNIPNAKINIINEDDYFPYEIYKDADYKSARVVFHMKNALRMIKESGIKYDYIMLTRSDMFLKFNFPISDLYKMNDKDKIYGITDIHINDKNQLFMFDCFFFGDYGVMSRMIRNIPYNLDGMHTGLAEHIQQCGLKVVGLGGSLDCIPIRPNCRNLKDEELTPKNISQKSIEWGANYFYP
jgi:hypothetical protein